MKKLITSWSLMLLLFGISMTAQTPPTEPKPTSEQPKEAAAKAPIANTLQLPATVTGRLQKGLNAEKANVGDAVIIKVTQDAKENEQTVVKKGAQLTGRITAVKPHEDGATASEIEVLFDSLKNGDATSSVVANILSVTKPPSSRSATPSTDASATTTTESADAIPGLQVTPSADGAAKGVATLIMNGGNLKLDSGTLFTVRLEPANAVSMR